MSLASYSDLTTAIGTWLKRADLASAAPDFITLCEAKVNRVLRINEVENRVTATLDEQYESLPTDFLEPRKLQITTSPSSELTYLTPSVMDARYPSPNSGRPFHYTIVGGSLKFEVTPSPSLLMELVYYVRVPALTAVAPTNWLMTNHPDVYLYGSLAEAEPYNKNDSRLAMWRGLYQAGIDQIIGADQRKRWGGRLAMVPDITPV